MDESRRRASEEIQVRTFCGIDIGLHGAIAAINPVSGGTLIFDIPVIPKGNGRLDYDVLAIKNIISCLENPFFMLEHVHAFPGTSATSMLVLGYGSGLIKGVLSAFNIPFAEVTPKKWKQSFDGLIGSNKVASIGVAKKLFSTAEIHLKKHHGRADALLLAEYGRRIQEGGK